MERKNRSKFIFGLAVTTVVCGAAGLLYFKESWRKEEMKKVVADRESNLVGNTTGKNDIQTVQEVLKEDKRTWYLSDREKKELQDRIKAMNPKEIEAVMEVIPVELCMKRIQDELDHAREFKSMIKKAYEMK